MSLISAASFGCIDRFDAIRNLRLAHGLDRRRRGRACGSFISKRHMPIGTGGFQPEFAQDFGRRARIDRQPRPHSRARRVVDLVDQAGGQFDKLPLFVAAMGAGLHVEIWHEHYQSRTLT